MDNLFSDFSDQFILTRNADCRPNGWDYRRYEAWSFAFHRTLPVFDIRGSDGTTRGWFAGYGITPDGSLLRGALVLEGVTHEGICDDVLERELYGIGGRFVAVIVTRHASRVYLDPLGSLALVFSPTANVAASTTTLVEWAMAQMPSSEAIPYTSRSDHPPLPPNHFYPAGLTHRGDMCRLLPNHFLDLDNWRPIRHWPTGPLHRVTHDAIESTVQDLCGALSNHIRAAAQPFGAYLPLTAGRDSRMLLACSRNLQDRITFVTFDYREGGASRVDVSRARWLAERFDLTHRVLPIRPVGSDAEAQYLVRIGNAGNPGKARDFLDACRRLLDLKRAWLTGYGGEIGRAFYWKNLATSCADAVSAEALLRRLGLPQTGPATRAMAMWLDRLPGGDAYFIHDLLYLEHRMGCWASPHLYGTAPFKVNVVPLSHRRIVTSMLTLPVEYRRLQGLPETVMSIGWPELRTVGFRRFVGALSFLNAPVKLVGGLRRLLRV